MTTVDDKTFPVFVNGGKEMGGGCRGSGGTGLYLLPGFFVFVFLR